MGENDKDVLVAIGSLTAKVDSIQDNYRDGRKKQIEKASRDDQHFMDIKADLRKKVDRDEIKPLFVINWLLTHWKLVLLIGGVGALLLSRDQVFKIIEKVLL